VVLLFCYNSAKPQLHPAHDIMSDTVWLRAADCPLLQPDSDAGSLDPVALRLLQRLLELGLARQGSAELAPALLEEVAVSLRADQAALVEPTPQWELRWQHVRRGARAFGALPATLLGEVLDRGAGAARQPTAGQPAFLAAGVGGNRVLLAARPREPYSAAELAYGVAAAHYLGMALERARAWDERLDAQARLEALVDIGRQLAAQGDTVALLEHIAGQAAGLLRCERTSIFLWDRARRELVGRPALGLPGGELRLPEGAGVVGRVVHSGQPVQVDDVRAEPTWSPQVDSASGFQTRSLLCVPLTDADGECLGALEALNKSQGRFTPADADTLRALGGQTAAALRNVREREALLRCDAELKDQARLGCLIVGESPAVQALRGTVERIARTDLPVLVLGESGTGKDVVARAVHFHSPRRRQPYMPLNCAAITETLLERELFGHEKGAYTGADDTQAGMFEAASGGTLFLDEVGDLSAGGQAKLLRVLEEKVVYRVGGTQPIAVDTRIVAATNRNLGEAVRAGKFRQDLFYRLTVVTIDLPPLRERRQDVLVLTEHFLGHFCGAAGRKALKLSADARKRLEQHDWPGNIRELRNLLERLAYLCPSDRVEATDLAFTLRPGPAAENASYAGLALAEATRAFQVAHIKQAIERAGGNMSDAARLLGLHRPNLYRKMRLLDMEVD
jgi:Nif-specific regulatory protein